MISRIIHAATSPPLTQQSSTVTSFIPVPLAFIARMILAIGLAWAQVTGAVPNSGLAHLGGAAVGLLVFFGERALGTRRLNAPEPKFSD
mgnify:CR=1 FL=1